VTGSSRWSKRIYHLYTSELKWKRCAQDKIKLYHRPGGTHTRPRGDVLAHRRPHVHDTSSIQEKHLLTNQTLPSVQHKDSSAHNPSKPPQPTRTPGTVIREHMLVTGRKHSAPRIAICFHMVLGDWSYSEFPGAQDVLSPVAWPINRRGGGKNKDTPLHPRMRASLQRRGISLVD
jgi:hypothetical protein